MFIEKLLWILLIFTLSVFFVTPVAIYSIVDPMRDKLVEDFEEGESNFTEVAIEGLNRFMAPIALVLVNSLIIPFFVDQATISMKQETKTEQ